MCLRGAGPWLGAGRQVLESGQGPGPLTATLQVHHGVQVVRDGVPGIGDELGEARVHLLLHLIVSASKRQLRNRWDVPKGQPCPNLDVGGPSRWLLAEPGKADPALQGGGRLESKAREPDWVWIPSPLLVSYVTFKSPVKSNPVTAAHV